MGDCWVNSGDTCSAVCPPPPCLPCALPSSGFPLPCPYARTSTDWLLFPALCCHNAPFPYLPPPTLAVPPSPPPLYPSAPPLPFPSLALPRPLPLLPTPSCPPPLLRPCLALPTTPLQFWSSWDWEGTCWCCGGVGCLLLFAPLLLPHLPTTTPSPLAPAPPCYLPCPFPAHLALPFPTPALCPALPLPLYYPLALLPARCPLPPCLPAHLTLPLAIYPLPLIHSPTLFLWVVVLVVVVGVRMIGWLIGWWCDSDPCQTVGAGWWTDGALVGALPLPHYTCPSPLPYPFYYTYPYPTPTARLRTPPYTLSHTTSSLIG